MKQIIAYKIMDTKTRTQVGHDYTPDRRRAASNRIDKLDNKYGGYRYTLKTIFDIT